jgi:hypothetical protein
LDLGEQADQIKFMIRDRGSNYTAAFDAVLAGAGIRTVLCNVQTPFQSAGSITATCWPPSVGDPPPSLPIDMAPNGPWLMHPAPAVAAGSTYEGPGHRGRPA